MNRVVWRALLRVAGLVGAVLGTSVDGFAATAADETSTGATSTPAGGQTHALAYDLPLDLGVTLGGATLAVTLELLAPQLEPADCRWCDRDSAGNDRLNGFDAEIRHSLRWSDKATAATLSNVFSYGLAPLAGVGVGTLVTWYDHGLANLPLDLLFVAEATFLAANLNHLTKFTVARERPDVHALSASERAERNAVGDNLSFYSGHTTVAFAVATSAGTVASMRGYRLAPVVWATGIPLAAFGGYLRMAADRHYATDVVAGALLGSAIGVGVPYLAHPRVGQPVRLVAMPMSGGGVLCVMGNW